MYPLVDAEKVLYRFSSGSTASRRQHGRCQRHPVPAPRPGVIETGCDDYGCRNRLQSWTTGTEHDAQFHSGRDGAFPQAGLINVNGTLRDEFFRCATPCIVDRGFPFHRLQNSAA